MTTKDSAQDPKEVTVSEGLAKVHEASEQLTEEEIRGVGGRSQTGRNADKESIGQRDLA
nr:hypothetical protein PJ912_22055 [Pectobacterium colocasium]